MIRLNSLPFDGMIEKEWLYTNGIGGYASSTICGMNTRRYHGLLIASLNPPTERKVILSKIEEVVRSNNDGEEIPLSTNQYPEIVHPEGFHYLIEFSRDPLPREIFGNDKFKLAKTIFMVYGNNTTIVEYENISNQAIQLKLNPLFVYRDFHGLFSEDHYFDFYHIQETNRHIIHAHYGAPPFYFASTKGQFIEERFWYKNVEYYKEQLRGQDYSEDTYSIGYYDLPLGPEEKVYLVFSMEPEVFQEYPKNFKAREIARMEALTPINTQDNFEKDLTRLANQFLVKRTSTDSYSLIAGYHWFSDWGRDTMISLLGLIALGKKVEAKSIISTFLFYVDKGMIPNRFPDYDGESPEYNTVDATLWLFIVLYQYDRKFNDINYINSLLDKIEEIILYHIQGTRYGIGLDNSGLLHAGEPQVQLTWMDAKVGDYVVTPRNGYPVEINVLWYNALKITEFFQYRAYGKFNDEHREIIEKIQNNFKSFYWNERGYLNDNILPDGTRDESIRPNQIYAISLPFTLLSSDEEDKVMKVIKDHLLTDCNGKKKWHLNSDLIYQ